MKRILLVFTAFLFVFSATIAQNSDEDGIIKACTDYVDGAFSADGDRLMTAVHPEMNKVIIEHIDPIKRSFLRKSRASQLKAVVNARGAFLPDDQRNIKVEVLDIDEGIAMANVISGSFVDCCQLVKVGEDWKIVNVLWTWQPDKRPPNFSLEDGELTEEMIKNASMDYIDGAYSGNADRMERALHPELNKVMPYQIPNSEDFFLSISGYGSLIEMTRAQFMNVPQDQRKIDFKLLKVVENMAVAKITSVKYIDYCHIGLVNGEAKIINVLWRPVR